MFPAPGSSPDDSFISQPVHAIDEALRFPLCAGSISRVLQHLFHSFQMWLTILTASDWRADAEKSHPGQRFGDIRDDVGAARRTRDRFLKVP